VVSLRLSRQHLASLRRATVPLVTVDVQAPGVPQTITDDVAGGRLATEHLLSLGHRRIAMISGPPTLHTSREREAGYVEAMREAGEKQLVVRADFTMAGGSSAIASLLDGRAPTAVFVASDTMALGVLSELARRSVDVPHDMSVIGFDDIPGLEFIHPRLTTIRVPMAELGVAGVERLMRRLDGDPGSADTRLHEVQLIVRESTGVCRDQLVNPPSRPRRA
jgi:LacI family transcriptional regulator